jgi:signal peptidase II
MLAICLAFAIAFLDQLTKYIVTQQFAMGQARPVIRGFFDLTYIENTGAAFGAFQNQNAWLITVSVAMLIAIVLFHRKILAQSKANGVVIGLLVGGIVGNLIDRVKWGAVIDFLDFHWGARYHFPAFNIADSAICVGVGLCVLSQFLASRREAAEALEASTETALD